MTNKDKALFEILRISLWGGKLTDTIDAESIIDELTIQAVEGIAATTIPNLKVIAGILISLGTTRCL